MAPMVDVVGRRPRVACCLLVAAALIGACARMVSGTPQAGDTSARPGRPVPIADLLIEPARFPARYPASAVPRSDVDRVIDQIDGAPVGFDVTPPQCAPLPVLADQKAAVVGTGASGATLTVAVIRPVSSLRARVTQLAECPSFTTTSDRDPTAGASVSVRLPPAPPVDAGDSYAVDSTATRTGAAPSTRTLTLVALVDDVEVIASWQQRAAPDDAPDAQALDTLFTGAVLKVRQNLPR
jgi:hypothetical protein